MEEAAAPLPTKGRLVIWKLVLENFKSYAGKRVVGPFHKCFTAIVGPNGSGKSNVIDALLFVFGKRAKQLRQGKVSELLHFSENHQNIQSAKVSVYFHEIIDKPNDQYEVVPDSTLVISRVAYKNNSSKYFINDDASTFTDVTNLLKTRGIDLDHNRFLILQGEVEQIAMMKPKAQTQHDVGMLEYLEDIIGSIVYVEKIEKAAEMVEKLNEERNEKVNRVKVAEKERDHLEEAKNEAMEYVTKEKELLEKQSMLYQLRRSEADTKAAGVLKKKSEAEAKWKEEKERMNQLKAALNTKENEYKKEKDEFGRMAKEMGNAKAEWAVYERKHIQLEQDIKHLKEKRKTLAEEIKKNEKKAQEKLEDAEAASKEADECADELGQLEAAAAEEEAKLEVILESLKGETAGLHDAMEEKQKEFMPFQKRLHAAQAEVNLAKSQRDLLAQRPALVATKLADSEKQLTDVKAAIVEKKALLETTRTRQTQAQARAKELEKQVVRSREEEQKLAAEVRRLQSTIEHTKETARAQTQRSTLLTRLMDAARSGTLKGIRGRLGDLGSIDPKYDVAISTAGPSLDHIVAETVEAASAAIAFLKKEMLGSTSFIVLEKIEYLRRNMGPFTAPEGVPRLYDLVKSKKPEYATAFYFALRDSLVAKDLEQARRIAYGPTRYRVVTLTGELIDVHGTMSGGGNTSTSGRMNTVAHTEEDATSSKDFKVMAKELEKHSAALQQLRAQREEEETELEALRKELEHLPVQARKLAMDVEALTKQSADLKARLKQLQPQAQLTEEEEESLAALEKQITEGERAVKKIEEEAAEVKAEVTELEKAIAAAGGDKLKRQKAKFEAATKAVDDLRRRINRAKVRLTSGKKESTQARSAFKEAESQLAKTEKDLANKQAKLQKLDDSAGDVEEAYKSLQAKHEEKEKKIQAAQQDFQKMKENFAVMRGKELELQNQLSEISKVLHGHQKAAQGWAQRITELHKKYAALYHDYLADEELSEKGEEEKEGSDNEMEEEEEDKEDEEEEEEEEEDEDEEEEDEDEEDEEDEEGEGRAKRAKTSKKKERRPTKAAPAKKVQPRKSTGGKKSARGTLRVLSAEELSRLSPEQLEVAVGTKQDELQSLRPNLQALKQYREKNREYESRAKDLAKITEERDGQRALYDSLRKKRLDSFMEGFTQITMKLKEMYQMITIGGDAELELVDSLDPFSEGVVFSVRPPKKSWKNIINLSGGEKTLASLALVFALHHYKPTPIYVMDEIDAALDFRNVSIIGHYIKERTKDAQFLVISLRNNMFELADRVVGIYKTHNASKSLPLNPQAFDKVLATAAQGALSAAAGKENRAPTVAGGRQVAV